VAAEDPGAGPRRPARPRRRVGLSVLVLLVVVVAAVAVWSDRQASHYYVYQPGTAPRLTISTDCRPNHSDDLELADGTPCARLIVPTGRVHSIDGRLLMVDVLVGKATPTQWLLHELGLLNRFSRGSQLIPNVEVLGTTPAAQLACQDDQEMRQATSDAPVVALQRLGYDVGVENHGALVTEVLPDSAAASAHLECNDLITAIDGHAVRTADDVEADLGPLGPGATAAITVQRTSAGKTKSLVLHAVLRGRPAMDGQPADPKVGFLGVAPTDDTTYTLPFDVSIDVGDIGGPSAGLALTLGLLDALSSGKLTGGHTIAATGTIAPGGAVGDVGGVAQKTVAVERAGAQLFLVPPQEYAAAESEANGKMKIEKVSTLAEALSAIKAFGGQIPPVAS
jgi:PDZ domain-containing protein